MTSFGSQGHVLTCTAADTPANVIDYVCISTINGIYRYTKGTNNGDNIAYDLNLNQWTANPTTGGHFDPSILLSSGSNSGTQITPTNADTILHTGYVTVAGNNYWVASFSVNYSTTPTTLSTNTLISISQQGDKVVAFYGGGNPDELGPLYISDYTGPRTNGHSHVNGTDTTFEWSPISPGTYEFVRATGTGYVPLSSVVVSFSKKRCSCNFW